MGVLVAQSQTVQLQMIEPAGQHWLAEHEATMFRLWLESKDAAQEQEG